ncbi:MAG: alpha/beta fold hydrolase [Bacteroidota bacterium]
MALISASSYPGPPRYQWGGHLQTILPNIRRSQPLEYQRERLELADGDFLDLDWLATPAQDRLVILSHGLEGDSSRPYMVEAARFFFSQGYAVLAWHSRSCSGEMNRNPVLYSHGQSQDLAAVVEYAVAKQPYQSIDLIGYSMGGNLTGKYLGLAGSGLPQVVRCGVAFSAPCWIEHSVDALERPGNWLYKRKFYRSLRAKAEQKEAQFPGLIDLAALDKFKVWRDFDRIVSAPLNGFETAEEFYAYASAANFMGGTQVPLLLVNALNDPIIPVACTPVELGRGHPLIHIEQPSQGGHVGFSRSQGRGSWMNERALAFMERQTV